MATAGQAVGPVQAVAVEQELQQAAQPRLEQALPQRRADGGGSSSAVPLPLPPPSTDSSPGGRFSLNPLPCSALFSGASGIGVVSPFFVFIFFVLGGEGALQDSSFSFHAAAAVARPQWHQRRM